MSHKFTDLHCKEVICIQDGRRLGFVSDAIITLPEGVINALVVPCPCRYLGFLGHRDDFVIPWRRVRRIGPDIVLVDIKPEECRVPRHKPGFLP